jgi:hypothetical protein
VFIRGKNYLFGPILPIFYTKLTKIFTSCDITLSHPGGIF